VFVANMTGNIVFIGFALAGAPGYSLVASLLALTGFLLGAAATGPAIGRWRPLRGRLLAVATTAELVLLAGALVIATTSTEPFTATRQNLIAVVAAIALGIQNASARELAVPDGATTVRTMTLTGFAGTCGTATGACCCAGCSPLQPCASAPWPGPCWSCNLAQPWPWPWLSSWSRWFAPGPGCLDNARARDRPEPPLDEIVNEQPICSCNEPNSRFSK
jgi:hypothetical protein